MTEPDLSTLPQRMRYAATVLEEAAHRAAIQNENDWTPEQLREDAAIWETEDRKRAEHKEKQIEELAKALYYGDADDFMRVARAHIHPWETYSFAGPLRAIARRLIESGWRKA